MSARGSQRLIGELLENTDVILPYTFYEDILHTKLSQFKKKLKEFNFYFDREGPDSLQSDIVIKLVVDWTERERKEYNQPQIRFDIRTKELIIHSRYPTGDDFEKTVEEI